MKLNLTPRGRTALYMGIGGFAGLLIGLAATGRLDLWPMPVILLAIFLGIVIGIGRSKTAALAPRAAQKAAAAPARSASMTPEALTVRFEFPDVPPGYPAVLGRGEPLHVTVRAFAATSPAEGAGVQLSASMGKDTLTGDGVTGTNGEVEFTLEPEGTGELALNAEAKVGERAGHGHAAVSIVDYDVEIERLFGEFRAYSVGLLGPEAHADTARELADKLRHRADPQTARALLELARVYELVAYGERSADRRLYLLLLEQLMTLEQAEMPDSALSREA